MFQSVEAARARQDPSGGYGDAGPTVLETAALLYAIKTCRFTLTAAEERAAAFLRARQLADGSWEGDPFATAWAVLALAFPIDTDADGIPDAWEDVHGLNAADLQDGARDLDGDGLSNLVEFRRGADPLRADTDGNSVADGDEAAWGSDPRDPQDRNRPPSFVSTPVTLTAPGAP
jgi:hypothetical protein